MRIRDVMKQNPTCIVIHDTCRTAARKMRDENIGFLPVCDGAGRVLGTLTDRDIALRVVAEGNHFDLPVSDVMSREVVACYPDDDLARAEQVMSASHKARLVVLDDAGRLIGVLSLSDVATHDAEHAGATIARVAEREAHFPPTGPRAGVPARSRG
jgi:CBS domain-containing protein